MLIRLAATIISCFILLQLQAQEEDSFSLQQIPSSYIDRVSSKADQLEQKLDKKSEKALQQMMKQEMKMKAKLSRLDSNKVKEIFGNAEQKYKELEQRLQGKLSGSYLASLDTAITSLKFLQQNPHLLSQTKEVEQKLKDALHKVNGLENQFQKAEEIKNFLRERKQFLRDQLGKLEFTQELKKISKNSYYFNQQLAEYKSILQDRKNAERKALELLRMTKQFPAFMQKNSMLASLFRLGDPNDPTAQASLVGLQSRTQVNQLIQQQISANGPAALQQVRENIQSAQNQLQQLKDKVNEFGGGSSDMEMPEGFRPNSMRAKTFFQRIQLSADFQTTRHNKFFPVNSDLGISASYMLNQNSMIAIGSSFKIGWGSNFNHIRLSSQGVSIRGGIDWRLKGNLFIAGNYEQNYFSEIRNIDQLKNYNSWKTAALLGLSKKYKAGKKRGGEIRLLYDFFYNRPPVRTQPITIRFGYNLK